jgi:hypothetical protein
VVQPLQKLVEQFKHGKSCQRQYAENEMKFEDNIVQMPPRDGRSYPTADCDPNSPLPQPGEEAASPEFAQLDINALFNMRQWVQEALVAKGAKVVGAGIGCGGSLGIADIQIELEGHQCNIEIRPLS